MSYNTVQLLEKIKKVIANTGKQEEFILLLQKYYTTKDQFIKLELSIIAEEVKLTLKTLLNKKSALKAELYITTKDSVPKATVDHIESCIQNNKDYQKLKENIAKLEFSLSIMDNAINVLFG